jgi:hypothetical protein
MEQPIRRFAHIVKVINSTYFDDLGKLELIINDDIQIDIIKIKVIPHQGIHKDIEYIITIKFQEHNNWPLVYIDSEIYDKIKTKEYIENRGHISHGYHKGICIKNLSYAYPFIKNFKELCDNKWENYIYYLITLFNNIQDFEKGNGLKSNYKEILNI